MVKCVDCGKESSEGEIAHCHMCGAPLCKECDALGLCSNCAELWEAAIDLEDVEAEVE